MDAAIINQTYDLLSLVEQDTHLRKVGNWYAGPCVFCGGKDRFVIHRGDAGWRWYCRNCGDGKYHTVVDYMMQRENVDFKGAMQRLGDSQPEPRARRIPQPEHKTIEPSIPWRARGARLVEECEAALWSDAGESARRWLNNERLLSNITLKRYRIGYNLVDRQEDPEAWGLDLPADKKIWLPRGIVLPCYGPNGLYYIKFRRPLDAHQIQKGERKYIHITGGKPGIFGYENLRGAWLAVFTEGEFDAMLLDQEAGDLAGIATFGSASNRPSHFDTAHWLHLGAILHWLVCFDRDAGGESGAKAFVEECKRARQISLPEFEGKDITDYRKTGGDLVDWLCRGVESLDIDLSGEIQ